MKRIIVRNVPQIDTTEADIRKGVIAFTSDGRLYGHVEETGKGVLIHSGSSSYKVFSNLEEMVKQCIGLEFYQIEKP